MNHPPILFPPALSTDEQAADWLLRLHQSPDAPQLAADCAAWCAADPAHQAAFEQARRAWDLCGSLPALTERPRPAVSRRSWAAACAILLAVVAGLWQADMTGGTKTGTAEWSQTRLSDGSQILLAPQTTLYATLDDTSRRITLDQGDAFFSVTPDPARPFRVIAGPLTVTVTGTRFAVSRRGPSLTVQVEEGRILATTANTAPLALTAGQAVRLDGTTGGLVPYTLPPDAIAPWRSGLLVVENRRVADVIEDLRPYLPGLVILTDDRLGQQRVTGVYSLKTPQAALRAVIAPFQGQSQSFGPVVTVISGRDPTAPP